MPNLSNITAPVTFLGYGRSGTSLMSGLFVSHPDFQVVGETAELVYGCRYLLELANLDQEASVAGVRGLFLSALPGGKKYWMHKPLGNSLLRDYQAARMSPAEYYAWYWHSLTTAFPDARYVTILRQPKDVVLSAMEYWGRAEDDVWNHVADMADMLTCPQSRVDYAVDYAALVRDPETEARRLFDYLDIPFVPEVMNAFDLLHAPASAASSDLGARAAAYFSRRAEWDRLTCNGLRPPNQRRVEGIQRLWNKFGLEPDLEIPPQRRSPVQCHA